jgi:PAS domain S-box-containing protein
MTKEISQDNAELFRLAAEGVRDFAVFVMDTEGRVLSWNPGVGHLLGYEEREWTGLHGSVVFTPEDRERGAEEQERETAAREGRALDERWHLRKDGTRFWASGLLMALRGDGGRLRGYCKMLRDVTRERRRDERLSLYADIVENAADAVIAVTRDLVIVLWNEAAHRLYGYTAEEAVGRHLSLLLPPERAGESAEVLERLMRGESVHHLETERVRKDGSRVPVSLSLSPVRDPAGEIIGTSASARDITERRRAEETLRRQTGLRVGLAELSARADSPRALMQGCAELVAEVTGATLARVWRLDETAQVLELQASAGMYTHLDGTHGRVPVGELKIGRIAALRRPHLTNSVVGDEHVSDREWVRREGMVAFAGYPLLVEDRVVGVMAGFWRRPLREEESEALGVVADVLAQGVVRKEAEEERDRLMATLREVNSRLVEASVREQEANELLERRVEERTGELQELTGTLLGEVKERQRAESQVKELLRLIVGVQEGERRRLARELHDHLGQQLSALRLALGAVRQEADGREQLGEQLGRAEDILSQLDSDVDFLAWELRPTSLDMLGLAPSLEQYVRQWSAHYRIPAAFHAGVFVGLRLSPEAEINLYRIAQEALQNVQKHAGSTRVSVQLEFRDGLAVLVVEDDGRGFDSEAAGAGGSMGLINMRERAVLVGGELEIESAPGAGTTVFVRVPFGAPGGNGEGS